MATFRKLHNSFTYWIRSHICILNTSHIIFIHIYTFVRHIWHLINSWIQHFIQFAFTFIQLIHYICHVVIATFDSRVHNYAQFTFVQFDISQFVLQFAYIHSLVCTCIYEYTICWHIWHLTIRTFNCIHLITHSCLIWHS